MLALIIAGALALAGFTTSRNYVRTRLRYVDAVQKPLAPIIAGVVVAVVAVPLTAILPIVGAGTALLLSASVAAGVATGASDIRKGNAGLLEP
ncbi:MAG TPA: hypothetical protein VMT93_10805 [Gemmatimonadaceae bacterium]|nr:hypothetical protein [Gemmatimonadaceae bacterium]